MVHAAAHLLFVVSQLRVGHRAPSSGEVQNNQVSSCKTTLHPQNWPIKPVPLLCFFVDPHPAPDMICTSTPSRPPDLRPLAAKAGRAGRLTRAVRTSAASYVHCGGAFLLPLGTYDCKSGSAGSDRFGSTGLSHTVHLLLGANDLLALEVV